MFGESSSEDDSDEESDDKCKGPKDYHKNSKKKKNKCDDSGCNSCDWNLLIFKIWRYEINVFIARVVLFTLKEKDFCMLIHMSSSNVYLLRKLIFGDDNNSVRIDFHEYVWYLCFDIKCLSLYSITKYLFASLIICVKKDPNREK